ncbi:helix-turn-helix domain-containing protein [Streptomyces oceani]|uniref:HTH cro/C1-type domain-containing protein n=1 Tax=Streptomyces oceani TaxID=1075402 RepID=A0A1E7KQA5_9ACTN|nr:helix-turn-helix transcriptional regulator [Streptomyces oceani]OEV06041.1 hypothetical protein AN216_00795 [Streptomyces oceani]
MGLRSNPTHRQRRLGSELRKLRVSHGLSAVEAGAHVGLGGPHLSHIEAGRTAISEEKLRTLTELYGCKSETFISALAEMTRASRHAWWRAFARDVDDRARDLAELEATSRAFGGFETVHIPGLLQTPEYAEELLRACHHDEHRVRRFLEYRLKRQELLSSASAPHYHAVVHEAALRMQFVDPEVLRRQLAHLLEVAELPHVTIQVVPFTSQLLPAVGGPFILFRGVEAELDTVYMEHDLGAQFLDEQTHVSRYSGILHRLSELALPPLAPAEAPRKVTQRDSLGLIQHLLYIQ